MNLADAQPGVFKMNLDAHLVCHLATTETWHSCRKGLYNSKKILEHFLVPARSLGLKLSYKTCIILF